MGQGNGALWRACSGELTLASSLEQACSGELALASTGWSTDWAVGLVTGCVSG